jgi:hypothetical protein
MSLLPKRRIKNPASQKEIATTKRSATIIGTGLSLLIPGGFFAGIGRKAIGKAFRRSGTSGLNLKSADTIGNRLRTTQAIMGTSRTGQNLFRDVIGINNPLKSVWKNSTKQLPTKLKTRQITAQNYLLSTAGMPISSSKRIAPTFANRKIDRTIQKAVEQGPAKFFSKGRHPKTGVTAGKRTPVIPSKGNVRSMYYQRDMKNPYSDLRVLYRQGARGGTSKGSLLRYNDPYSLRKYRKYAPKNFDNIPDDI